jgi:hypothetical protein
METLSIDEIERTLQDFINEIINRKKISSKSEEIAGKLFCFIFIF